MTRSVLSAAALIAAAALAAAPGLASAQAYMDPARIGEPPVDAWTTFHGDFSGRHYSTLDQINRSNVKDLALAWAYRANTAEQGAQTGGMVEEAQEFEMTGGVLAAGLLKSTPIFVNGVLYFSAPDRAWAVDARTGREIWRFFWRTRGGDHIGNRGMGMYKNILYLGTPDGYLVALDAATGRQLWVQQIGRLEDNYYNSASPMVIKNHVIVGVSGDHLDVPGWIEAREPETGELQWKWYTTPEPGTPEAATWPSLEAMQHGGGMTWQPVTYDPDLNLLYVSTGNPNPVYAPEAREGDNLYSCSLAAIDLDTGKMVWVYQTSPNEAYDFDSNQVPVLFDAVYQGRPRKLVFQATRNGYYFLLDRVTGEHLLTTQVAESVNWAEGYNAKGQPVRIPEKLMQRGGALISPSNGGVQNWAAPTLMPNGLLYLNAMQGYDIHYTYGEKDAEGRYGHRAQAVGGYDFSLRAIDALTGKAKWIHRYAGSEWNPPRPHQVGALLGTAGGLVFSGAPAGQVGPTADGFMVAWDPDTGRQLWHVPTQGMTSNTPITYMMDGRQYLVFAANDTLYAFTLPK